MRMMMAGEAKRYSERELEEARWELGLVGLTGWIDRRLSLSCGL